MNVSPVCGLSYAIAALMIGTFSKVPCLLEYPVTLTLYPVCSMILQLGPATQVSACESNSQVLIRNDRHKPSPCHAGACCLCTGSGILWGLEYSRICRAHRDGWYCIITSCNLLYVVSRRWCSACCFCRAFSTFNYSLLIFRRKAKPLARCVRS
jgi:hypothetical protein